MQSSFIPLISLNLLWLSEKRIISKATNHNFHLFSGIYIGMLAQLVGALNPQYRRGSISGEPEKFVFATAWDIPDVYLKPILMSGWCQKCQIMPCCISNIFLRGLVANVFLEYFFLEIYHFFKYNFPVISIWWSQLSCYLVNTPLFVISFLYKKN